MRGRRVAIPGKGREALASLLVFLLAASAAGCGKKEQPTAHAPSASGKSSEGPREEAQNRAGIQDEAPAAGVNISAVVVPFSPSRIAPPSVSVIPTPGHGTEVLDVRWFVNGAEKENAPSLSPSSFRKGDAIRAVVTLRPVGGKEAILTTPETVAGNALPSVAEVALEPRAPVSGGIVRAIVQAHDPDGDPLTIRHRWFVDDKPVAGEGDALNLKGVRKGSWVHVSATPNDGFADGAWRYSHRHQVVNGPPVLKNQPPATVPPSRLFSYTIAAEDPDGDPLTYELVKGPEGMSLAGATITWKITDGQIGVPAGIVIRISDDDGASTVMTMNLNPQWK
jgi:predicted small lipoprotein YifL